MWISLLKNAKCIVQSKIDGINVSCCQQKIAPTEENTWKIRLDCLIVHPMLYINEPLPVRITSHYGYIKIT